MVGKINALPIINKKRARIEIQPIFKIQYPMKNQFIKYKTYTNLPSKCRIGEHVALSLINQLLTK